MEDFMVDELPSYLPTGEGSHLFLRVEKRGMTTDEVAHQLADQLCVSPRGIGYAGRKDKWGVCIQWFSIPDVPLDRVEGVEAEGFKVLEAKLHGNKLRVGHAKGNTFRIVIRDVVPDALARAEAIVEKISRDGLPNRFGSQRFGVDGRNVEFALGWINGGRRPPKNKGKARLMVSSLQSHLFNLVLSQRMERGLLKTALVGDVMKRHDSGGMFVADDLAELATRLEAREVSSTGPIFGARMWWPEGDALELEEAVLAQEGLTREHLERFRKYGAGSRRLLRVFPGDLKLEMEGDDALVASFFLESGSYATTLLEEITKTEL
jgi:tRNA pseudouridine13 synthase